MQGYVMKVLVAAFGNELRGDDGFGIAVLRQLEATGTRDDAARQVKLVEIGTAGLRLAQELLSPCDRLIVIDAVSRGTSPGTVCVLKVEDVREPAGVDMHLAVPSRALAVAKALGALPRETFFVGCEVDEVDELTLELTPRVRDAVDRAAREVRALLEAR
jgi:hydrogenase maturation protease